ncbi:MAG: tetratricopeptide repeat protein [Deltaproteobacteria bacterium]|nr:tetratricopeptide repeat protein [Deltaproteobacteria bacterium]
MVKMRYYRLKKEPRLVPFWLRLGIILILAGLAAVLYFRPAGLVKHLSGPSKPKEAIVRVVKFFYPANLAGRIGEFFNPTPRLEGVVFEVNGQGTMVRNNETLPLKTMDEIRLVKYDTSLWFNRGVRLYSKEIPVVELGRNIRVVHLLGDIENLEGTTATIEFFKGTTAFGKIALSVQLITLDWIEKAAKTEDIEQKIKYYQNAAKLSPDNTLILNSLAELYEKSNQFERAAVILDRLAVQNPETEFLQRLAEDYFKSDHLDKALSIYLDQAKENPEFISNLSQAAELLEKTGRFAPALEYYQRLNELVPAEQQKELIKKIAYLYVQLDQPEHAVPLYESLAQTETGDVNLFLNLSRLYRQLKNDEKYAFYLKKALDLNQNDLDSRSALVDHYVASNRLNEAATELKAIVAKDSKNLAAYIQLANVYEKLGQKKELLSAYQQIMSLNPGDNNVVFNAAAISYELNHYPEAETLFKRVVTANPKDIEAHDYLFNIYQETNRDPQAIEEAEKLIGLKPDFKGPYDFLIRHYEGINGLDKVVALSRQALLARPNDASLYEHLAYAYLKQNKVEDAKTSLQQAAKLAPSNINLQHQLAIITEKEGKVKEALELYQKILEQNPNYKPAAADYLRLKKEEAENN